MTAVAHLARPPGRLRRRLVTAPACVGHIRNGIKRLARSGPNL